MLYLDVRSPVHDIENSPGLFYGWPQFIHGARIASFDSEEPLAFVNGREIEFEQPRGFQSSVPFENITPQIAQKLFDPMAAPNFAAVVVLNPLIADYR